MVVTENAHIQGYLKVPSEEADVCSADGLFVNANATKTPLAKATTAPARSSAVPCITSHSMIARARSIPKRVAAMGD